MRTLKWFRIGYRFKRWLVGGAVGGVFMIAGLVLLLKDLVIGPFQLVGSILFLGVGIISLAMCFKTIVLKLINVYPKGMYRKPSNVEEIGDVLYRRKVLAAGPKITVIGGGTGISTLLRGLKHFTSNITAIITVFDDGGGSGVLRDDLDMLPPGDIRNCMMALAETESVMENLLQYRFTKGYLSGQSFGNLFLAALNGISDSFEQAVRYMSEVLAVTGRILPVTEENVKLKAEMQDGSIITGESNIGKNPEQKAITRVFLDHENVQPPQTVIDAIREADMVILGPGSLYTSIIPNLLVENVCTAIEETSALKLYIANIMTQPGETDHYRVSDHIDALQRHGLKAMGYCLVNNGEIPEDVLARYREDNADVVMVDRSKVKKMGMKLIEHDCSLIRNGLVRHDPDKLAQAVMDVYSIHR